MTIDINKVVSEIDRCLFKRMDLTERELKVLSGLCAAFAYCSVGYMLVAIRHSKKQDKALRLLQKEIEGLKNAKGD